MQRSLLSILLVALFAVVGFATPAGDWTLEEMETLEKRACVAVPKAKRDLDAIEELEDIEERDTLEKRARCGTPGRLTAPSVLARRFRVSLEDCATVCKCTFPARCKALGFEITRPKTGLGLCTIYDDILPHMGFTYVAASPKAFYAAVCFARSSPSMTAAALASRSTPEAKRRSVDDAMIMAMAGV